MENQYDEVEEINILPDFLNHYFNFSTNELKENIYFKIQFKDRPALK